MTDIKVGYIYKYNVEKGYGFIRDFGFECYHVDSRSFDRTIFSEEEINSNNKWGISKILIENEIP